MTTKHWIKIAATVGVITLVASHHLAVAQPAGRGPGNPGAEARQSATERAEEAAADRESANGSEKAKEASTPRGPEAARDAARGPNAARGAQSPADSRSAPANAAGAQGQTQRDAAMQRQADQFDQIHARRLAELERLRDLAVENDRPDMISRIDGLISREVKRHAEQKERLSRRGDQPAARSGADRE